MTSLTDQFLDHKRLDRGLSPNTIATYARTLRTLPQPETATRADLVTWWRSRADKAVSTRNNELAAVRQFYVWCEDEGHRPLGDNPTRGLHNIRQPNGDPRPIGRERLRALLAEMDGDLRRAVALGAFAGLRISEAASLNWADVDMEANRLHVRGKGGKARSVGLPYVLLDSLLPVTGGNIVAAGGHPYTAASLQRRVNRAIQRIVPPEKDEKPLTFHQLRHRWVTVALAGTGNLLAVSRAAGHSSVSTTAIYAATADTELDRIAEAVAIL